MKEIIHTGKRNKLDPRYIGPFKVLERIGLLAYWFQLKKGLYIAKHMNNYTKLLTDFVNVDVDIKKRG